MVQGIASLLKHATLLCMNLTVYRAWALFLLIVVGALGYVLYSEQKNTTDERAFRFGLDLVGGSHLVYEADTSALPRNTVAEGMEALRTVIETRVNTFGVSEPVVQVEKTSALAGEQAKADRLVVELPGITNLDEAVRMIGATPSLDFKLEGAVGSDGLPLYVDTGLTGAYLERARLDFTQGGTTGLAGEPLVLVDFNDEGKALFGSLTKEHVGERLAIFLDGKLISNPVIREPILGGTAVISGDFTPEEAKAQVRNLNIGALPVPITLASTQTVGATLGAEMLHKGVQASLWGFGIVILFMVLWYRIPGLVASVALLAYVVLMLGIFMYLPVTITAAGIAGFLLSVGMAVDANVLIFERMKEELRSNVPYLDAVRAGFSRAWPSIRDGNMTSLISAVVLFWVGTSLVKGFALVFGLGVLVSMFTALTLTRTMLVALSGVVDKMPVLLRTGFSKK
jgi:protein-export SecD/SecF family membrane protein